MQLRHPNEVGGAYFSFTIFVNILIGMMSALWTAEFESSVSQDTAVLLMSGLCVGITLSYTCFLLSIKQTYVQTFYDTHTSNAYSQNMFLKRTEDNRKFSIFLINEHKWRKNIGPEVKIWLNSKLAGWLKDKPAWLDDQYKSIIPDWIVDDYALLMKLRNKKVQELRSKRRNSTFGALPQE